MKPAKKHCKKCGTTKPADRFYTHNGHSDGLSSSCIQCTKEYNHRHYHEVLKHDEEYKERVSEYARKWHKKNKKRNNKRVRDRHRELREACIKAYGGACDCCGETRYEFLAMDHIDGGGRKHRKKVGTKIVRWLVKNEFPEGFRVLCHNCNAALGYYGYCPHEEEE